MLCFAVFGFNGCTQVLYPALALQLKAAGHSKQSLAQWLCGQLRFPWDNYSDSQQESIRKAARAGSIPGLREEDCKFGGTIPNFNPRLLAILVAGPMAVQAMGFYGGGATRPNFDNAGSTENDPKNTRRDPYKSRPIKTIHYCIGS
jgi:hypothetical protein